jgi:DNA-binding NarL/FixJ family response regulator
VGLKGLFNRVPFHRILVVEDHETVRHFICSELQQRPDFRIVGEASDGLSAVQKAQELQPDLVLLDVGLPKLNGLEAARQISILVPNAKLLFLSLESSARIMQEAFRLGAGGYVHKMRAQLDLLPAVDTVLGGRRFISSDVAVIESQHVEPRHEVQFYSNDDVFLDGVIRFIAASMKAKNPVILLATKAHRESLAQKLAELGFDINEAIRQGTYISLDAADALSRISVNGVPEPGKFLEGVIGLLEPAAIAANADYPRIAILGECAGLLCQEGRAEGAIQLEKIGNDLIQTRNVDILCTYPLSAFQHAEDGRTFTRICSEHSAVHSR